MKPFRFCLPNVLFGFAAIAVGLTVVRTNENPWIVIPLYGITVGSLRQAVYYFLDHDTLRSNLYNAGGVAFGGIIALALFEFAKLAIPAHAVLVSVGIMIFLLIAHYVTDNNKKSETTLPQNL